MKLVDMLFHHSQTDGSHCCLLWNGKPMSYQEVAEIVEGIADQLRPLSVKGKVLGIRLSDPKAQLFYFLAAEQVGAVPLLLHEYLRAEELVSLWQQRPLDGILSDEPFAGIAWNKVGNFYFHSDRKGEGRKGFAVLSSGSSGLPKVFFRRDESWSDFFPVQNGIFHIDHDSKLYCQGSMAFTGNLNMVMAFLYEGATIVGTSRLFPKTWMKEIQEKRVTHVYMIPSKLSALCRVKGEADQVSHVLTGSQLMTEKLLSGLERHFPKSRTILYYGASEMSYVSYIEGKDIRKRPDSVGRPFPGIHISIDQGNIMVRTPYAIEGAPQPVTCHDLGRIDEEGYLHFLGRKEDVYHVKGNHVSKQKVLSHLLMLPGIEEAELVGEKQPNGDDRIVACLVGDPSVGNTAILHGLEEKLQSWELPSRILWLTQIPRTSTGKTDKKRLRELLG